MCNMKQTLLSCATDWWTQPKEHRTVSVFWGNTAEVKKGLECILWAGRTQQSMLFVLDLKTLPQEIKFLKQTELFELI